MLASMSGRPRSDGGVLVEHIARAVSLGYIVEQRNWKV